MLPSRPNRPSSPASRCSQLQRRGAGPAQPHLRWPALSHRRGSRPATRQPGRGLRPAEDPAADHDRPQLVRPSSSTQRERPARPLSAYGALLDLDRARPRTARTRLPLLARPAELGEALRLDGTIRPLSTERSTRCHGPALLSSGLLPSPRPVSGALLPTAVSAKAFGPETSWWTLRLCNERASCKRRPLDSPVAELRL
jgi:hypothetical protein